MASFKGFGKENKKAFTNAKEIQNGITQAFDYLRNRKLSQSQEICEAILEVRPDQTDALLCLSLAHGRQGNVIEAIELTRRLIVLQPDYVELYSNLGNFLSSIGQYDEAITAYKTALARKPSFVDTYVNLGHVLLITKQLPAAVDCYRQAISFQPQQPDIHSSLANALRQTGELDEAERSCRRALLIDPDFADAHLHLGHILLAQDKTKSAAESYHRVITLQPQLPDGYCGLGNVFLKADKLGEASQSFNKAFTCDPQSADACIGSGLVLQAQQQWVGAEAFFRQALVLQPDSVEAFINLGVALYHQSRLLEAEAVYQQAIVLAPSDKLAHYNLGNTLNELGLPEEAEKSYCQAIACNPNFADAHANCGFVRLLQGNFAQGWPEYEWRWRTQWLRMPRQTADMSTLEQPLWDGSSLDGKTILIHTEQGHGDTFQFVRYAELLKSLGATVVVECLAIQERLLSSCPGIDALVVRGNPQPAFDCQAPLLSLPKFFGTQESTIPHAVPYLHTPETTSLPEFVKQKLQNAVGRKIGFVWSAGNVFDKRHCNLENWTPLFALPGLSWFSLYKGEQATTLQPYAETICDIGSHCQDFADTAWAIDQLDLIISVDTSVAHLAGAMGKPTWVLLPFAPDWRWLLVRQDSPWYPTMKLFRQTACNNWQTAITAINSYLMS
jgi:tetratricopeptide (TPR) repeat protein